MEQGRYGEQAAAGAVFPAASGLGLADPAALSAPDALKALVAKCRDLIFLTPPNSAFAAPLPRAEPTFATRIGGGEVVTRNGSMAASALRVGQKVLTRDNSYQPIRWLGWRRLQSAQARENPGLRPVRIGKDALAPGQPAQNMHLWATDRVLVCGTHPRALFGEAEVLVMAHDLLALPGVEPALDPPQAWHSILLDSHEIILRDGVWLESLRPEAAMLAGFDLSDRAALRRHFGAHCGALARKCLTATEARALVARMR